MNNYEFEVTEHSSPIGKMLLEIKQEEGWELITVASPATNWGSYHYYWKRIKQEQQ